MKKFCSVLSIGALLFMGACQNNDGDVVTPVDNGETTKVEFELDASSLAHDASTRTYTPVYTRAGFSIYAFKQTPAPDGPFVFHKQINLSNMSYSNEKGKWVASDNLPIGTYKFVHAYGIEPQKGTRLSEPAWSSKPVLGTSDLAVGFNGSGPMTEIFLETEKNAGSLVPYELGINESANQTVSGTLKRAVSRVDIMFISAVKEGDDFREVAYSGEGGNIFGGKVIENIELQFNGVNNRMNFFGVDGTTSRSNVILNLNNTDESWYNFAQTITVGTGASTVVGTSDYLTYDNVLPTHIMNGNAHVFGSYLFPNADGTPTTGLKMVIKPTEGESRIIPITDLLPLERNKVTIVKVYVLNNNNVFSTTVEFEVEIITAWEDANEVSGIIS